MEREQADDFIPIVRKPFAPLLWIICVFYFAFSEKKFIDRANIIENKR